MGLSDVEGAESNVKRIYQMWRMQYLMLNGLSDMDGVESDIHGESKKKTSNYMLAILGLFIVLPISFR